MRVLFASLIVLAAMGAAPKPRPVATRPPGISAATPPVAAAIDDVTDAALQTALTRIAASAPGYCGIVARHLESGRVARVHAVERIPMASTFKLAVAVAILDAADHGRTTLTKQVTLGVHDIIPGSGGLAERAPHGGITLTIHDLLDLMITKSDNTACDVLLREAGGTVGVRRTLTRMRVAGLRVERSELELGDDVCGVVMTLPYEQRTLEAVAKQRDAVAPTEHTTAAQAFLHDPRDTGSAEAFTQMLARLWRRELLSKASSDTLLAMLQRNRTGDTRLRAGLPPGTRVYDKTGTAATWMNRTPCVNDVGIIRLPGSGGTIAIAVLVRDVRGPIPGAERTIASVAAAVFKAWNAPDATRQTH
jgi:beta-lactamase class A